MRLLALLPDPVARARLRSALSLKPEIRFVANWTEPYALADGSAADLLIFDPYVTDACNLESCSSFHCAFPSIVLLPYSPVPLDSERDLRCLARLGVQNIIVQTQGDDPIAFGSALRESLAQATTKRALSVLKARIPDYLLPLVRHLLLRAHRPVRPDELSRVYFRHSRTLRRHLKAADLPRPEELIGWARLCHAAHWLCQPGHTVSAVALFLEFPSASALGNQLRRYTGVCPKQLTAAGGLEFLLARFRARCRTLATKSRPAE